MNETKKPTGSESVLLKIFEENPDKYFQQKDMVLLVKEGLNMPSLNTELILDDLVEDKRITVRKRGPNRSYWIYSSFDPEFDTKANDLWVEEEESKRCPECGNTVVLLVDDYCPSCILVSNKSMGIIDTAIMKTRIEELREEITKLHMNEAVNVDSLLSRLQDMENNL